MSEKDLALSKVSKALEENNKFIKMWTSNAVMAETRVKTHQSMLPEAERLHKIKIRKIQAQIDRSVKNAKTAHNALDELLEEKKAIHIEFKAATHYGQVQCEYCQKYFTSQGLSRHRNTCISKPENKVIEKQKAEITGIEAEVKARKEALEKELKTLKNKMNNKTKLPEE